MLCKFYGKSTIFESSKFITSVYIRNVGRHVLTRKMEIGQKKGLWSSLVSWINHVFYVGIIN